MQSRTRKTDTLRFLPVVTAVAAVFVLLTGCHRAPDENFRVVDRQTIEFRTNVPHKMQIRLAAGTYSIRLQEADVDVSAKLTTANGLLSTRDPVARRGIHVFHVALSRPTAAELVVTNDEQSANAGRVTLEVRRWQSKPGAEPSALEQGDIALADALVAPLSEGDDDALRTMTDLQRAIQHFETARAPSDVAAAQLALASIQYDLLGAWLDAQSNAEAASKAFTKAGDSASAAAAQVLLAAAKLEQANEISSAQDKSRRFELLRSADGILATSSERLRELGLLAAQADAINLRGVGRWYGRDFEAARGYFLQASRLAQSLEGTRKLQSKILGNLAWLDFVSGRPRDAAAEYEDLLASLDPDREAEVYAAHVANYALVQTALGNFDIAIRRHAALLEHATKIRDESLRLQQLIAISSLALQQGDARRALDNARTALAATDPLKEGSRYNSALRVAGQAALRLSEVATARDYFMQLLDRSMSPRESALARVLLAQTHRAFGDTREARQQLERALEEKDDWLRAQALTERARLLLDERQATAAIDDLTIADESFARIGLDTPRIDTRTLLARAYTQLGKREQALTAADEAIALVRSIRSRSADLEVRASFLAAQYAPYEAKIDALLLPKRGAAGRQANEQSHWAAIAAAESARAQGLAELQRDGVGRFTATTTDELRLRDTLVAQRLLLERRLQRTTVTDPSVIEIRREIAEAEARLAALAASAQRAPRSALSSDGTSEVQLVKLAAALPEATAVAYFFVGQERSHFWIVRRNSVAHRELPGRLALHAEVFRFLGLEDARARKIDVTVDTPTLRAIGERLAETGAQRIAVLADGPLNSAPFAALRSGPQPTAPYLVEQAVIAYLPSLAATLPGSKPVRTAHKASRVAIVSDPVYAVDDIRLAAAGPAPSRLRASSNDDLTRLPYSAAEAREIKRLYTPAQIIDLGGFNATAAAVAKLPFNDLAIFHFAGHAIARDDEPLLSALHLSVYDDRRTPLENPSITAERVLRLGMRADLVVLSGCSTAGGVPVAGEGMLGLTHSFLANGSRSVVASLWPVDDAQTARLMGRFHDAYRAGASAPEALAIAQRAALAGSRNEELTQDWFSFVAFGTDLVREDTK